MDADLTKIKQKCEKAWLDHENAILSWDEAAAVVDAITCLCDFYAENVEDKDAPDRKTS